MTLVVVVSLVFGVALAAAAWLLRRAYRRLDALQVEMTRLARELEQANEELGALLSEVSGSRILIEIINPMSLARERSRWGAALVSMAPRMLRRRVYDTVAREIKQQLAAQGVEAHLQIFHPTGS